MVSGADGAGAGEVVSGADGIGAGVVSAGVDGVADGVMVSGAEGVAVGGVLLLFGGVVEGVGVGVAFLPPWALPEPASVAVMPLREKVWSFTVAVLA